MEPLSTVEKQQLGALLEKLQRHEVARFSNEDNAIKTILNLIAN